MKGMKLLERRINKEIRDYSETIFFGLTLRQCIFSALACAVAVGLYFLLRPYLGMEALSWICILAAAPFAVLGFVQYNGMNAEQFISAWIKSQILSGRVLVYKPKNLFFEICKDIIINREEGLNNDAEDL